MGDRAEIRDDFIRRLFAVAISIGFAATLIEMDWVEKGSFPDRSETEQLAILLVGLFVTVLSWDGYLASIKRKPLYDYTRFAIDVLLVFVYMFFLISSKHPNFWLPVLVTIFFLYVIWDFLTVREHVESYIQSSARSQSDHLNRASLPQILSVYTGGVVGRTGIGRGPIITVSWLFYFAILMTLNFGTAAGQVYVTSAFAIAGLVIYRIDKAFIHKGSDVAGFPMRRRFLIVSFFLVLAAIYFYMF